jgi:hypothetical protein
MRAEAFLQTYNIKTDSQGWFGDLLVNLFHLCVVRGIDVLIQGFRPGANVIKPFSPSLTVGSNKLECLIPKQFFQASLMLANKAVFTLRQKLG